MSINTAEELAGLQNAGTIVRRVIDAMGARVAPGVTTAELDQVWTVPTADGRPSAHYEHTLVVTDGGPILLTAA